MAVSDWLPVFSLPWFFTLALGAAGLCVGSFLNVVIHRLPKMLERGFEEECAAFRNEEPVASAPFNLAVPRSQCPHCGHMISAWENIPVLSFLLLGGKCRACRAAISARYPLVELAAAGLGASAAWYFGFGWQALAAAVFLWTLLSLAFIDADTYLLPDCLTLPLLWAGLLLNLFALFAPLSSAVIGAAAGYLSLWSVYWAFKFLTGKEGMGYGDFKLLAALGAWFGWAMLPTIILIASLLGAVLGMGMIALAGHARQKPIPFGPYLALAGVVALFWGEKVNQAYLTLFL